MSKPSNYASPDDVEHAFSDAVTTPIVKNHWGDSSGVRGAAWLWPESGA